jgi:hypothetical protein
MRIILYAAMVLSFACLTKKTEPVTTDPTTIEDAAEETSGESDCPEGVKVDCNVPTMTREEIAEINEANRQCVEDCVTSRQAEAMSADLIQEQCQQGCNQKHFVGQVQVAPTLNDLENVPEEKPEGDDKPE